MWGFAVSVASHDQHPGDGRLPGEKAGRRERALHSAADAGLPGEGGRGGGSKRTVSQQFRTLSRNRPSSVTTL